MIAVNVPITFSSSDHSYDANNMISAFVPMSGSVEVNARYGFTSLSGVGGLTSSNYIRGITVKANVHGYKNTVIKTMTLVVLSPASGGSTTLTGENINHTLSSNDFAVMQCDYSSIFSSGLKFILHIEAYSSDSENADYMDIDLSVSMDMETGSTTKVYNGTSWVVAKLRVWNGSSWASGTAKVRENGLWT